MLIGVPLNRLLSKRPDLRRLVFIPALAVLCLAAACTRTTIPGGHTEPYHPGEVVVDFGVKEPTGPNLIGFTHGLTSTQPATAMVSPLHPQLIRSWPNVVPYVRAASLGAMYTEVVSDEWGYPADTPPWRGRGAPYDDYSAYETFVTDLAERWQGRPGVVWDLWNEPNGSYFWSGTEAQHLETFRRTHDAIRAVLGSSALIEGPSLETYDAPRITRFLDFAKAHDLQIDVLSWHDFFGGVLSSLLRDHLEDARQRFVDNPAYASVGIREIHIDETLSEGSYLRPGDVLGALYFLEKGGAAAAGRACWNESTGVSNCYNGSLNGLLTRGSRQPRAAWWAEKAYADSRAGRVRTTIGDPNTVAFSSTSSSVATVTVGRLDVRTSTTVHDTTIDLRGLGSLPWLNGAATVRVRVERIPDLGEAEVASLPLVEERVVALEDGSAAVRLAIRAHEAVRLTLTAP